MTKIKLEDKKILLFHAFLSNSGGAEKVLIDMRNHFKGDIMIGGIRKDIFNKESQNPFSKKLFDTEYKVEYLHNDSKIPVLRHIKRQLAFLFSPKINKIKDYDIIIFTGNIFWVALRLRLMKTKAKLICYCHTPPRLFTDQKEIFKAKLPYIFRPFYELLARITIYFFKLELKQMDLLIGNSENIKARIKKYLNLDAKAIFVPVETKKYQNQNKNDLSKDYGDFFLSHSRLEDAKRIKLIVQAFKQLPHLKLIVISTGPLKDWLINEIKEKNISNIEYKGLVSEEEKFDLVNSCLAGVVIPVDEDAGMVQLEVMAAGKPVLGVSEGGILETVTEKTGYLIKENPSLEDLVEGLKYMSKNAYKYNKNDCIAQAKKYDEQVFFDKFEQNIQELYV
jgi:glycosyltransferase involved in cell wall biosynthesis